MRIFHRSSSSSSRASTSTNSSASLGPATSRSSIDSVDFDSSLADTIKPQKAPVLGLPIELIQQVASYLDTSSSASLSLSSRYIYYALGTTHLTTYIDTVKSRFEKRRKIEDVVERAFPGHWFCAWCDQFHAWNSTTGPKSIEQENRDCADFNSFLPASETYILRYHHIRLALHHSLHGPSHGIPLSSFTHTHAAIAKIYRTPIPTKTDISAKISSNGHFLLHTSFALLLPSWSTTRKSLLSNLWPLLPHILAGHRDSPNGHTGLMAAIDNILRRGWTYPSTQTCSSCKTDWAVNAHFFPHSTGAQVRLVVRVWRDLGDGRNPFDSGWRAHGVAGVVVERRVTGGLGGWGAGRAGDVRREFEEGV